MTNLVCLNTNKLIWKCNKILLIIPIINATYLFFKKKLIMVFKLSKYVIELCLYSKYDVYYYKKWIYKMSINYCLNSLSD